MKVGDILCWLLRTPNEHGQFKEDIQDEKIQTLVLNLAETNGTYYVAASRILQMNVPLIDEERWELELLNIQEIKNSISELNAAAAESDSHYLLIKEYRTLPNVARDIDILIRESDRDRLINALRMRGFIVMHDDPAETSLRKIGARRIDIYGNIRYLERDFVDEDTLWHSQETHSTHGVAHPGLSPATSLLVNSIHGLLGHSQITLLDYFDSIGLMQDSRNIEFCRGYAEEAGWLGLLDEWFQRIHQIGDLSAGRGACSNFPKRNGILFTYKSISRIDGTRLAMRETLALLTNLMWDDLVYVAEKMGISQSVKSSAFASGMANQIGHGLRRLRGDSKRPDSKTPAEPLRYNPGGK